MRWVAEPAGLRDVGGRSPADLHRAGPFHPVLDQPGMQREAGVFLEGAGQVTSRDLARARDVLERECPGVVLRHEVLGASHEARTA